MKLHTRFRCMLRLLVIMQVLLVYGTAMISSFFRVLIVYNFLRRVFFLRPIPAQGSQQLRLIIEALGPTYIKFGQMLSTRVDFFSVDTMVELKKLQDNVPAESEKYIQEVLHKNFKKPLGEDGVFVVFNPEPIAAASIAQVHWAKLADGQEVAVKIRRPKIEKTIEADLALLAWFSIIFDRFFPHYRRLKMPKVVAEFSKSIQSELNLRAEAARASRFETNLKDLDYVGVPEVLWDCSTEKVLTTEWIHGTPIDERDLLIEQGHCPKRLCENLTHVFFHMVFLDGYFHADLHPGNIFVTKEGQLKLVDFGIVGHMDIDTRLYLAQMMSAFLQRDYRRAAEVHLEAGYVPYDTCMSEFEDAMREVCEPIFNRPLAQVSLAYLLISLFSVTERFQMETRMELLLLQKTMVILEGVGRELEPEMNIWDIARPLMLTFVTNHMGPKGKVKQKWRQTEKYLQAWLEIPKWIEQTANKSELKQTRLDLFPDVILCSAGGALLNFVFLTEQPWWAMVLALFLFYVGIRRFFKCI
ncbi:MAG: 2-polyprenylphenol 6-hydroxylase [Mariprofundaceae bacterium]|nr:2-polyprenylphenol 6-hydroxylase [Mariprofundaceae bacterium]